MPNHGIADDGRPIRKKTTSFSITAIKNLLGKQTVRPIKTLIMNLVSQLSLQGKAFKIFITIYLGQYVLHMLWLMFLQASYINIVDILDSKRPGYNIPEIRPLLDKCRNVLTNMTSLRPELATTTMFFYALCAFFTLSMYFCRFIEGFHHKSQDYPIVRYYENRPEEKKRIARSLDDVIADLLASNLEYTKQVISYALVQDLHLRSSDTFYSMLSAESAPQDPVKLYGSHGSLETSHRDGCLSPSLVDRSWSSSQLPPPSSLGSPSLGHEIDQAKRIGLYDEISTLSREYSYIYGLKLNQDPIWPAHRQPFWLWWVNIARFVIFYTLYLGFWLISSGSMMVMLQTSKAWQEQHNVMTNPSLLRQVVTFEMAFNMYFLNEMSSPVLVEIWLSLFDQFWHIYSFRRSVWVYLDKLAELKLLVTRNPNIYLQESRQWKLTHDCERDCITAYIKFRYIIYEVKPMIANSTRMATVIVTLIFLIALFTYGFGNKLEAMEWFEMQVLVVGVFCCCNWMAFIYCLFHAYCKSTINLVWTIVNSAILDPDNYLETSKGSGSRSKIDIDTSEDLTYDLTLISPHIILLWRRILVNHSKVLAEVTINVFDSLTLEYEGIINLNFWFLSIIIIIATNL